MHFRDLSAGEKIPSKKDIIQCSQGAVQLRPTVDSSKVQRDAREVDIRCEYLSGLASTMDIGDDFYLSLMPLVSVWDAEMRRRFNTSTIESLNGQVKELFDKDLFGTHCDGCDGRREYLFRWEYAIQSWNLNPLWRHFPSEAWYPFIEHEKFLPTLRARFSKHFGVNGLIPLRRVSCHLPPRYIPALAISFALEVALVKCKSLSTLGITPFAYHMNSKEDLGFQYGHILETSDGYCIVNQPFVLFHVANYASTFEQLFLLTCYDLAVSLSKSVTMWRHARKVRSFLEEYVPPDIKGGITLTAGEDERKGGVTLSQKGKLSIFKW